MTHFINQNKRRNYPSVRFNYVPAYFLSLKEAGTLQINTKIETVNPVFRQPKLQAVCFGYSYNSITAGIKTITTLIKKYSISA